MRTWARKRCRATVWGTTGLLALVGMPYLLAWLRRPDGMDFTGLLLAWQDGLTYYAKMQQGAQGAWLYRLSMTAEPGPGALLYPFYLLLGHLARMLHLPLVAVYHGARLLGAVALALALARHWVTLLPPPAARWARVASLTALGMGWLALTWGYAPADLWVTEMYPLAAAFVNPHFPWAMAALVALVTPGWLRGWRVGVVALFLAALSPFGAVLALALRWWQAWPVSAEGRWLWALRRLREEGVAWLPAVGYLAYVVAVLWWHPVLHVWQAQSPTPAPPWWDLALSLAPWWVLALPALGRPAATLQAQEARRLWGGWVALALVLAFLPWGPQRRFLLGVAVPLIGLAALTVASWPERRARWVWPLAWPGTLFLVLLLPWQAAQSGWRGPYLYRDETQALHWLATHTSEEALVLAAPESGGFIAALAGRRVLYGHPMETAQAVYWREATAAFFACTDAQQARAWLRAWGVDWVYYGPAEAAYGPLPAGPQVLRPVQRFGQVVLYIPVEDEVP